MSNQLPRSTSVAAGLAGVLALGGLLGWGYLGDRGEDTSAEPAATQGLPELPGGFEAIPAADLFATVAAAQRAAGGWEVSSVAAMGGQQQQPATLQQIALTDDGADFRITTVVADGRVEGLWVDDTFYIQGLNPKAWAEKWYRVPDEEAQRTRFADMAASGSAAGLTALGEPATYDVIGVEQISELDDDVVEAVHYRVTVDPAAIQGAQGGGDALTVDLWVDSEDRPVQIDSVLASGGQEYRTTLFFSDYGADFDLVAPARADVTDRTPPKMLAPGA